MLRRSLPALAFALLVVVVYADPLFTGRSFTGRDLLPYGFPLEKATHDSWARGRLPVWNEDVSGGRPILPNPNAGALYPLRPALSLAPFPIAMRLFPVLHWVLAAWGMLALLRALGASAPAAWVGAGTYAFSGVLVSEVFYLPLQAGAALQPWALWALAAPSAGHGRRALRVGAVYGLMLLAGDVFSIAVAGLAAVVWIATEVPAGRRGGAGAAYGGGLLLGALAAAPQLAATGLLVPETQRAVSGISLGESLAYSLPPWRLVELVVPYPFGETWALDASRNWGAGVLRCFFATLFCGAFAVVAYAVGRGGRGSRFAVANFAVIAVLASVGTFAPAGIRALASPVPLRYPEKFVVGAVLAASLQAGLGFDRIAASARRGARLAMTVASALAFLALAAWLAPAASRVLPGLLGADSPSLRRQAEGQVPLAFADAGLGWIGASAALGLLGSTLPRRRELAAGLLAALPLLATRRIAVTERDDAVLPPTAFARAVARRDPESRFRVVDASRYRPPSALERAASGWDATPYYRRSWYFHTPSLWSRGTVFNSDLDGGDFSRVESLRRVSSLAAAEPSGAPLFESVSLRYSVRYRDQGPLPGFARFGGDALQDWDENAAAEPDVRLVPRWREAANALEALRALPRLREERGRARDGPIRRRDRSGRTSADPPEESRAPAPHDDFRRPGLALRAPDVLESSRCARGRTPRPDGSGAARVHRGARFRGAASRGVARARAGLPRLVDGTGALRRGRRGGARPSSHGGPMTPNRLSIAPFLLFAALVVAVYSDPLLARRVFTGRDLIAYNIPMEKSVHDAWASGELPVWTPEVSGGRPLAPNPNVGAFYPVRLLLSRLPFPTFLRLYPALHWIAAGCGMLLLLSSVGVSRTGAWLGAVTYVFSGVSVSECFYPHIQPGMTLLPWILWQARRARGARGTAGLAVFFALDMLAGDVFTIAVALVCAALWAVLEEDESAAKRALGRLTAAVALAALAAAPQILATALWIPETNRGVLGMRLSNALLYTISGVAAARVRRSLSVRSRLAPRRVGALGRPRPSLPRHGSLRDPVPRRASGHRGRVSLARAPSGPPLRPGAASRRARCLGPARLHSGVLGRVAFAAAAAQSREVRGAVWFSPSRSSARGATTSSRDARGRAGSSPWPWG